MGDTIYCTQFAKVQKRNFTRIAKIKECKYVKQVKSKYKTNNKHTKVNKIDKNK